MIFPSKYLGVSIKRKKKAVNLQGHEISNHESYSSIASYDFTETRTDSKKITQEYLMQRAWKPGLWRENQICRTQSLKTMSQNGEGNDGADSSFDEKLKPWIYFCWRSQGKLKFTGGRRGRERYILRSSNVKISQKKTFGCDEIPLCYEPTFLTGEKVFKT